MSETARPIRAIIGVGLSGFVAGISALCTVGCSGIVLLFGGYIILDVADVCEFEEIAFLIVHGKLPTRAELRGYKAKLISLRGLPTRGGESIAGGTARGFASDGRDAHGIISDGLRVAGKGRSERSRRARYHRPANGFARFDAAMLVPLRA